MSLRLLAALGAIVYVATLLVVPLANPTLDVLRLHPEDYALHEAGVLVVVGYVAFAIGLASLAAILARHVGLRSRVAAACFAIAALVCIANAIDPTLGTRGAAIEYGVFGLVIGPLVVSIGSPRRGLSAVAIAAGLLFVAMIVDLEAVGGIVNRLFDAVAAAWVVAFALTTPERRSGIMRQSGEVA